MALNFPLFRKADSPSPLPALKDSGDSSLPSKQVDSYESSITSNLLNLLGLTSACLLPLMAGKLVFGSRRFSIKPDLWEKMVSPAVRKVLSPQVVEEIIHQSRIRASGTRVQERVVKLISSESGVSTGRCFAITFDFQRRQIGFFSYRKTTTGPITPDRVCQMVFPPPASSMTHLKTIKVRTVDGRIVSWMRVAKDLGYADKEVLKRLPIPLEFGGLIARSTSEQLVLVNTEGSTCSVLYHNWDRVYRTGVRRKRLTGHQAIVRLLTATTKFHSHPQLSPDHRLLLEELLLRSPEDLKSYLIQNHITGGMLANNVVTIHGERVYLSVMIPKDGATIDHSSLMEAASRFQRRKMPASEYLDLTRRYFDLYLIHLRNGQNGELEIIGSLMNPALLC